MAGWARTLRGVLTPDLARADAGLPGHPRPGSLVRVDHPYAEVHHVGAPGFYEPDPIQSILRIDRDHRARGWNGIFYGVTVSRTGKIIEGRGVGYRSIGRHRRTYDDGTLVNPDALTVLVLGHFDHDPVTPQIEEALRAIAHAMPDPRLRMHGMRHATACPGRNLRSLITSINSNPMPDGSDMILEPGDRGGAVIDLQRILIFWGYLPAGADDGIFGANTARAAQSFKATIRETSRRPADLGASPLWGPKTFTEYGAWLERLA